MQWAEMFVAKSSLMSCMQTRFLIGSHTMPAQRTATKSAYSDFIGSRVYECLCITCHLHFWQNNQGNLPPALLAEWPGSFMCHCRNTEVKRTPNKSQHTKLTLEKKILSPLLPGFELAAVWSRVWHSTNKLSRLSCSMCCRRNQHFKVMKTYLWTMTLCLAAYDCEIMNKVSRVAEVCINEIETQPISAFHW